MLGKMKRAIIFFIVFIISMIITTRLFGDSNFNSLVVNLLISGLLASIIYWFTTVWYNQKNTDN